MKYCTWELIKDDFMCLIDCEEQRSIAYAHFYELHKVWQVYFASGIDFEYMGFWNELDDAMTMISKSMTSNGWKILDQRLMNLI